MAEMDYDDGSVAFSDDGLIIRRYDLLLRRKTVPYTEIRRARQVELRGFRFGNWRLWGSSDLRHWFNFDRRRPRKHVGLVLDLGQGMTPIITPDDPQRVIEVLRAHGVEVAEA
jgi:hypothetical protein